jgi:hypothetical protein
MSSPAHPHRPSRLPSWGFLTLVVLVLSLFGSIGVAQRRRRTPPPPPPITMDAAVVSWSLFVSAYGETPSSRRTISSVEPGPIPVPLAGWACTYGAANRARLNDTTWSEVRSIECTHGDAVVTTSGFCQVVGASWGARAGVLSLGSTTGTSRLDITLDCEVH